MRFRFLPIDNKRQFSSKTRKLSEIKFIVIHDTGNTGKGANAYNHYRYLQNATRQGSAHYYIDDTEIVQPIGDSRVAWSVGDTHSRYRATRTDVNNYNSISLELCINEDGNIEQAYKNMVELTKNLMNKFNIPIDRVVRHYDVSGKVCPYTFSSNNWAKWFKFKKDVQQPIDYIIDTNKDSEFVILEKQDDRVRFDIDGNIFNVNGYLENGRNYVQARELLEKMGYEVFWEHNTVKGVRK